MEMFKVNDWVFDNKAKEYGKILVLKDENGELETTYCFYSPYFANRKLEKVTKRWEIMLLELGRKTPEFKPGDVLVTYQDVYVAGYHDHDDIVLLFEENLVIRFCPEEHSIEV